MVAAIGAWRIKESFEELGTDAKPCSAESALSACLTERRRSHQWLARVRPSIRMSAALVIIAQISGQAVREFRGGGEVASLEEATSQRAEPQFHLVEPRAMFGREMEYVLVVGIRQECTPLVAGA